MGESEGAERRGCAAQSGEIRFGAQVEAAGIFFQQEEGNFPLGEVGIKKRWVQKISVGGNGGGSPWTLSVWNLSSLVSLGYRTSMELEKARTKEE